MKTDSTEADVIYYALYAQNSEVLKPTREVNKLDSIDQVMLPVRVEVCCMSARGCPG
jgi:hypothetical protein